MDCRRFHKLHPAYLDDTLSGVSMDEMRRHLTECEECAGHDSRLRRALVLVRSTAPIVPSTAFRERLATRLAAERTRPSHRVGDTQIRRVVLVGSATAALLALSVWLTSAPAWRAQAGNTALAMAPIVVRPPALPAEPMAAPAMFATVSSSLPVYPAVLLAQRATEQFAVTHARTVSFQAAR
jgi:hypothetical protein